VFLVASDPTLIQPGGGNDLVYLADKDPDSEAAVLLKPGVLRIKEMESQLF